MPQINISRKAFIQDDYQALTTEERLTLFELTALCPINIEDYHAMFEGKEAAIASLYDQNFITKNEIEYGIARRTLALMRKDNSTERVRASRERKMDQVVDNTSKLVELIKAQVEASIGAQPEAPAPEITRPKLEQVPYEEVASLYNEHLAVPCGLVSCNSLVDQKRRTNIAKSYKFLKEQLIKRERPSDKEFVLKAFKALFKFCATTEQVTKKTDTWKGDIEYFTRDKIVAKNFDMYIEMINRSKTSPQRAALTQEQVRQLHAQIAGD